MFFRNALKPQHAVGRNVYPFIAFPLYFAEVSPYLCASAIAKRGRISIAVSIESIIDSRSEEPQ